MPFCSWTDQGRVLHLVERGLLFRPDWETVVTPQIDWLAARPEVDAARIAAMGRSWGGYLAPRAATAEPRLAALIADAPQYTPGTNVATLLPEKYRNDLDAGDADTLNGALRAAMAQSPKLDFSIRRGMLTHGCSTPLDYLRGSRPFTWRESPITSNVRCCLPLARTIRETATRRRCTTP